MTLPVLPMPVPGSPGPARLGMHTRHTMLSAAMFQQLMQENDSLGRKSRYTAQNEGTNLEVCRGARKRLYVDAPLLRVQPECLQRPLLRVADTRVTGVCCIC